MERLYRPNFTVFFKNRLLSFKFLISAPSSLVSYSKHYSTFFTLNCMFIAINNYSNILKIPNEESYYALLIYLCMNRNWFSHRKTWFVFGFHLYSLSKSLLYCQKNWLVVVSLAIQVNSCRKAAFLQCVVYLFNILMIRKF